MTTDPVVESVWVVPGADGTGQVQSSEARDEVWMIVKRTINGSTKRYVEVLERDFEHGHDQEDAYYADSLITYDQPLTVTGLSVAAAVAFTAEAVHFDGATSLDIASLTATNSAILTFSYWYRIAGTQNKTLWAVDPTGDSFIQDVLRTGPDIFAAVEPYTGKRISFADANTEAFDTWHHVMGYMDVNHADGARPHSVWVDDVDVTLDDAGHSGGGAFTLTANGFRFSLGDDGFGNFPTMDFADFWWGLGADLNPATTANRRLFRSAAGKPVDLGTDGSTPTGTAPTIYLSRRSGDAAAGFATNRGTGGAFVVTGALADAASSPSD